MSSFWGSHLCLLQWAGTGGWEEVRDGDQRLVELGVPVITGCLPAVLLTLLGRAGAGLSRSGFSLVDQRLSSPANLREALRSSCSSLKARMGRQLTPSFSGPEADT